MSKKRAIIIVISVVLLALLLYFYYGVLYKEGRKINEEQPEYSITATELFEDYNIDASKADSLYLNKTIEVKGEISGADDVSLELNEVIFCSFNSPVASTRSGSRVAVKGRCIGFDELFGQVKLDQCTIVK